MARCAVLSTKPAPTKSPAGRNIPLPPKHPSAWKFFPPAGVSPESSPTNTAPIYAPQA